MRIEMINKNHIIQIKCKKKKIRIILMINKNN